MSRLRDHDLQPDAAVSPKKNTDPHVAGLRQGRAGAGSLGLRSPFPHRRLPEPHPARNSPAPSETPSQTSHRTPGAALARPPTGLTALWPVPITGSSRDRRPGLIASCPPTAGTTPVTRETLEGRSLACSLSNGPARPSGRQHLLYGAQWTPSGGTDLTRAGRRARMPRDGWGRGGVPAGLHVPQRTGRVATQARATGGRTTAMANGRGLPGGRGRGLATPPPPPWGGAGAGAGSAGLAGAGAARWSWQEVGATAPGRDTMRPVGGDRRCPEKRPGLLLTANGRMGLRAQTRSRVLSSGRELALSTLHGTLRVQKETPEPEPYSAAPTVAPGGRGVRSGR